MKIEKTTTNRGFIKLTFNDRGGEKCSLQESSSGTAILLGIENADPQIMASDAKRLGIKTEEKTGFIKYSIPKEVVMSTRMHLTVEQVKALLPILENFVKTGEL